MKLDTHPAVDALVANEPCLAAAFCSYAFDPGFFEDQLLHALLRLRSDPHEEKARFFEEARAALQRTPVACIVDSTVRQPGRRLPYDLLEVSTCTFHPKLALLVYDEFARLRVGSGNLTRAGHGGSTELFFQRDLSYDEPSDVGLLRGVVAFLRGCEARAKSGQQVASQLGLALAEIEHRTREVEATSPDDLMFLSSFDGPILPRYRELVPRGWKPQRVSLLAPFHEQDDRQAAEGDELYSVVTQLASEAAEVDVGVLWKEAPLAGGEGNAATLSECEGELCGRVESDDDENRMVNYLTLEELTPKRARGKDRHGRSRQWPRGELEVELEGGEFFRVAKPRVHGPRQAVERLVEDAIPVRLLLHPGARFEEGRPTHRPLHAKLYLLQAKRGDRARTWVLLGSANASRNALLRDVEGGGNVEACVAFVLEGEHTLLDFAPELVVVSPESVDVESAEFTEPGPNLAAWISSVVYRAAERVLEVEWAESGPAPLEAWKLLYRERELDAGEEPGRGVQAFHDFTLEVDDAELQLAAGGEVYSIPIIVDDLAKLPVSPILAELSLEELLALLGNRLGVERLRTLKSPRSPVTVDAVLEAIFGDGFGTVDVFKAWWAIAQELADDTSSFAAFRLVLEGTQGARAVWTKLREAAEAHQLSQEEVWFYGAELQRELGGVEVPDLADQAEREALLRSFLAGLKADLRQLAPAGAGQRWLEPIVNFYGGVL